VQTDEALQFIADVFWFTLEFGVVWEDGELRAYGAGILSSYGEIEEFRHMEIRPLDFGEMGTMEYDITKYQPVLYAAESMDHLVEAVGGFFAAADDRTPSRYDGVTRATNGVRGARRFGFPPDLLRISVWFLETRRPAATMADRPADRSRGHVRRHHAPALDHPDLAALAPRRRRAQRPPLRGQRRAPALGARAAAGAAGRDPAGGAGDDQRGARPRRGARPPGADLAGAAPGRVGVGVAAYVCCSV
jgi:hypothetical protein